MLGKILALIAALSPTMASAHCCCEGEHRHHAARYYREDNWETARFQVTAGRPCRDYPVSAAHVGASGVTWVKLRVDDDGFVQASRISESSGRRDLDRAALACVAGWHLGTGAHWREARIVWRWHWVGYYG